MIVPSWPMPKWADTSRVGSMNSSSVPDRLPTMVCMTTPTTPEGTAMPQLKLVVLWWVTPLTQPPVSEN
jgi:hypothetical protein